jgi:hypothetical protein
MPTGGSPALSPENSEAQVEGPGGAGRLLTDAEFQTTAEVANFWRQQAKESETRKAAQNGPGASPSGKGAASRE